MSNEHDHISIRVSRETDERIKQLRARMLTSAVEHVGLSTLKHGLSKGEVVRAAIEALENLLDPPVPVVETKPKKRAKSNPGKEQTNGDQHTARDRPRRKDSGS